MAYKYKNEYVSFSLMLVFFKRPERVRTESCASQISVVSEASEATDSQVIPTPDPFSEYRYRYVNFRSEFRFINILINQKT